jgi:macrolide-specific efflux system membrane fusion protein
MAGTVVTLTSRQGQTLNVNQQAPTIMRIADLSTMTVQTQVSEADIGKLKVGMPVYFTTLGGQDYRWHSELNRVEPTPTVSNNVVLYNALFEVPNDSNKLMTQMSTQVFFVAASAKDALLIPASAVNFQIRKPDENPEQKRSWQDRKKNDDKTSITDKDAPAQRVAENHSQKKSESSESKSESSEANAQMAGENKAASDEKRATEETNEEGKLNRKHRSRHAPGENESKPQPATVQVMDKKGNLTERKIMIGISNRVQVEVLEGLQEGENVVSGMRQIEKAKNASSPVGTPGAPGANPRMMR